MCFYASQLWCNYSTSAINRLKVAYNDAYRILHGMTRYHSARVSQIYYNIDPFYALQRKIPNKFVESCHLSQNLWLKMLISSDCFYDFIYYDHWNDRRSRHVFLCFYSAIFQLTSAKFQTFAYNSRTVGSSNMKFGQQFEINELYVCTKHVTSVLEPENRPASLA